MEKVYRLLPSVVALFVHILTNNTVPGFLLLLIHSPAITLSHTLAHTHTPCAPTLNTARDSLALHRSKQGKVIMRKF